MVYCQLGGVFMGLFGKKPLYKYKPLEKYKVDIEKENEEFRKTDPYHRMVKYEVVGETSKYTIYCFKADATSEKYLLRQEKCKAKNVVFLGRAKTNMCIFNNKVFAINRINYTSRTYHPLYCIDIETGICREIEVLSNKACYIAMHYHCQDCVEQLMVNNEVLIMQVTRYKESSHCEEECKYQVLLQYRGDTLLKEYRFEKKDKKQSINVGDTVTVNILDPLGGLSPEEFFLFGNDDGNCARKEQWVVKQETLDVYKRFVDENTGELYVVIYYENENKKQICVPKEKWEEGRRTYYN